MTDQPADAPDGLEPVDAAAYAAHLDRLDRLGREALAADPAQAIQLVREANDLVATLLPMHRQLMEELEHHRASLQAACEELARSDGEADDDALVQGGGGAVHARSDAAAERLARLSQAQDEAGGDGDGLPF